MSDMKVQNNVRSSAGAPLVAIVLVAAVGLGCTPTIKVEAPDKPIVINLNIKIEQEVRVKIENALEDTFDSNPDLFN